MTHRWAILRSPLVSFFSGGALLRLMFRFIMSFSGLGSPVSEYLAAHLSSVHPDVWGLTKEPAHAGLLALGCRLHAFSASVLFDLGPLTVGTADRRNLPRTRGCFEWHGELRVGAG